MRDKKILKIVWRKSIASLHRLTQAVQSANLRRTAGDPTWVIFENWMDNGVLIVFEVQSRKDDMLHDLLSNPF